MVFAVLIGQVKKDWCKQQLRCYGKGKVRVR